MQETWPVVASLEKLRLIGIMRWYILRITPCPRPPTSRGVAKVFWRRTQPSGSPSRGMPVRNLRGRGDQGGKPSHVATARQELGRVLSTRRPADACRSVTRRPSRSETRCADVHAGYGHLHLPHQRTRRDATQAVRSERERDLHLRDHPRRASIRRGALGSRRREHPGDRNLLP